MKSLLSGYDHTMGLCRATSRYPRCLKNSICRSRFFAFSFDIGFDNRFPFSLNTTYLSPTFLIIAVTHRSQKNLREARGMERSRDLSRMLQPFFALAQTRTTD
jgi:hypothetical protein